ncbi:MAG: phage protein Gp36 family protein [Phycisphaerae bacterium]
MAYCAQSDIELEFGATNVAKWADIDNDGDATTKSNRITEAIAIADEEIDEVLKNTAMKISLTQADGSGTPKTINRLARVIAGLWLYESRGAEAYTRDGTPQHGHYWRRAWVERYLEELRSGTRKLDALTGI